MNIPLYIFSHKLFKKTSIYALSSVIRNAVPFLILPVLTRYLTPSDYGIVATFQIVLAIAVVLVSLNMQGAVSVNFFKLNKKDLKDYLGNIIFIEFLSFILILGLIFFAGGYLLRFTKLPQIWLLIVILAALCRSIIAVNLTLWQVEQKALAYGLFQILQTVFDVSFSLVFVVALSFKWQGRLLGIVISSIIFGMLSILLICKKWHLTFSLNKDHIKDALLFGLPLVPHSLSRWIQTSIDRFFISLMVGVSAMGIYVVGYQVGMIIGILAMAFNQAWYPFLFEKLKENKYATKVKIVKFTYIYFLVIIILALMLSFFALPLLSFFVGKAFYSAHRYVFWIALGYAANGMYFMVVNYIFYVKKTYILAWITAVCAFVNVVLNYFLIKANGPIGAAQATTASFFLGFILTWISSAKVCKMPWLIWKHVKVRL